ncbi:hypothetical protein GCM10027614_06790 [Micromonospora vulcania]
MGQDGRTERQERDIHQQQRVEQEQQAVRGADVIEHDVVVHPHLPDQQEGEDVGHVRGPQLDQTAEQVFGVLRRANLQDEQSDGDGDDRVAEGDDPPRIPFRADR